MLMTSDEREAKIREAKDALTSASGSGAWHRD